MLSWIFFIIGSLFGVIYNIQLHHILNISVLVLNTSFISVATIFYAWAIGKYSKSISDKNMVLLIGFTITLIIFVDFYEEIYTGRGLAFIIVYFIISLTIIFVYIIPLSSKEFRKKMGKSLRWYYIAVICYFSYFPLFIITSSQGYGYGVYNAEDPGIIMLHYIPTLTATLLLILLQIHLEYNISDKVKFELKDKYSHDLGNIMQAISTANEIINKRETTEAEVTELGELVETKIKEASKLIREIREL